MQARITKKFTAKPIDAKAMRLELLNGLRKTGTAMRKDFQATVATWEEKPEFDEKISLAGGRASVTVTTANEIYGYVDQGTKAHDIYPKKAKRLAFQPGYRAKTQPGVIGSGAGGADGGVLFRPYVRHPGTKARKFSKTIAAKWRKTFPSMMKGAMKKAAAKSGHAV